MWEYRVGGKVQIVLLENQELMREDLQRWDVPFRSYASRRDAE